MLCRWNKWQEHFIKVLKQMPFFIWSQIITSSTDKLPRASKQLNSTLGAKWKGQSQTKISFQKHFRKDFSAFIFSLLPKFLFQSSTPCTVSLSFNIEKCRQWLFHFACCWRSRRGWLTCCLFFQIHQQSLRLSPDPTFCSGRSNAYSLHHQPSLQP